MKKWLLFVTVFCIVVLQKYELVANQILKTIVNYHTNAFDSKNLYQRPLDSIALVDWQSIIKVVGEFLQDNAQKQKKLLADYFVEMHKANRDLINTIKKVYTAKSNQEFDIHIRQQLSHKFEKIEKRARFIQKTLYWVDDTNIGDAKAIKCAQHLAQFIAVTARKARLNLF